MPAQRANVRTAGAGGKNVVNLVELLLEALSKSSKQVPKLKPPPKGVPSQEQVRTLQELGRKPGLAHQPVVGKEIRDLGVDPAAAHRLDEDLQMLGHQLRNNQDPSVLTGMTTTRRQASLDQLDQLKKEFGFSILSTGRPTTGTIDRLIDSLILNRKAGGLSREQLRKQFLDEFGKK